MRLPWNDLPTYLDQDGHLIRVTGTWCRVCSYPTHPAIGDTHPLCADTPTRATPTGNPRAGPPPPDHAPGDPTPGQDPRA